MNQTYEIKSVAGEPKEWSGQYGPMLTYTLDLMTEDNVLERGVELNRKPESRAPQSGERVVGYLEETNFGSKLRLDFEATKELNQGGSSGSSERSSAPAKGGGGNWKPRAPRSEYDPEDMARQTRSAAQGRAINYAAANGTQLDLPELFALADEFEKDVIAAGRAASQNTTTAPPPLSSGSDIAEARPTGTPDTQSEQAHQLDEKLDAAGVIDADERRWLTKAWSEMEDKDDLSGEERRNIALAQLSLGDAEAQQRALKRLRDHAGKMPDSFRAEDDIPFARPEYRELFTERERSRF